MYTSSQIRLRRRCSLSDGFRTAFSSGTTWTATVARTRTFPRRGLNFGSVSSLKSTFDATGTISVQATNSTPYTVGLNAGGGNGATTASRKMTNAGSSVTYSLYSDSARAMIWGNTIRTDTVATTGTGTNQALTVYGRVPSQSSQPPGTYTDTVIVTVTY